LLVIFEMSSRMAVRYCSIIIGNLITWNSQLRAILKLWKKKRPATASDSSGK